MQMPVAAASQRVRVPHGQGREEQREDVVQVREADRDLDPHRDEGQARDEDALPQSLVVGARAKEVPGGAAPGQDHDHQAQDGHQCLGQHLADLGREGVEQPRRQEADGAHLQLGVAGVEVEPAVARGAALVDQLAAGAQVVPGEAAAGLDHDEPEHGPCGEQQQVHPRAEFRYPHNAPCSAFTRRRSCFRA
ncbi:hypothetical protein GCM10020000_54570 [Streptomyces olivoverticillatus]